MLRQRLLSFNRLQEKMFIYIKKERKETFNIVKDSESLHDLWEHQPLTLTRVGNGKLEFLQVETECELNLVQIKDCTNLNSMLNIMSRVMQS